MQWKPVFCTEISFPLLFRALSTSQSSSLSLTHSLTSIEAFFQLSIISDSCKRRQISCEFLVFFSPPPSLTPIDYIKLHKCRNSSSRFILEGRRRGGGMRIVESNGQLIHLDWFAHIWFFFGYTNFYCGVKWWAF